MKVMSGLLFVAALFLISGCAVIDFLDGKHLQRDRYDEPQNGYNRGGGSGGGHNHH